MARAVGSGVISFGLVSIPVRLFPATQPKAGVSFHLLHRKDGVRLRQQYVCPQDDEIVPRSEMARGYEFARDQYVMFSPEELKALEETPSRNIEITEFVPLSQVDPVYFDKPYYLGVEGGGEKAYRLLADSMRETGRAAIARYAARGKQYLVMLRPFENGMVMQQLLYADEVRSFQEVPVADTPVREKELELAKQLIGQISSETFNPGAYEDEVKKRIEQDVQRKVEGKEITVSAPPEQPAQIVNLMEALQASLKQPAGERSAEAAAPDERPASEHRRPARASTRGPRRAQHPTHEPRRAKASEK